MVNTERKRAVFYTRVSTAEQAISGYSLGAQQKIIEDYCIRKGYQLVGGYSDEGISGATIEHRPQIQDLIEDSQKNEFDIVIIWNLSRLSRRSEDTGSIIKGLIKNNISIESISENIDFNSVSGILMSQLLSSLNEYERNIIAENVALGHKAKANQGSWNGNKVFGYDNVKKKYRDTSLVINKEEAKVVRDIYQSYLAGNGLRAIANDLNAKGYTTKKNNAFSSISVRDILDNRLYRGDIVYGKKAKNIKELQGNPIIVTGLHDAIIDPKTWDKVAKLRLLRSRNPEKSRSGTNLLTGIIKCPQCGGHMVINNSYYKLKDGTKTHKKYYVCGTFKNKGATVCGSNGILDEVADKKVAERFAELLNSDKLLDHLLLKMKETTNDGKGQLKKKLQLVTDKIISSNNQILFYQEKAKSDDSLADIWQEAIQRLQTEIEELREEVIRIDQRLTTDYSDYDSQLITRLVNALIQKAQNTTEKSYLKDLYLAFIKEIQWDKKSKKFDMLLYFDEGNLAEYLGDGPEPDPEPDNPVQNNAPMINTSHVKTLPNGGFFLRRPIEIWV